MSGAEGLEALGAVGASTERFADSVRSMSDAQAWGATLIPPWTRGHVITHVARAADSYRRLLTGAIDGVEALQYPSMAFRAEQIEDGARRPVEELAADVVDSSALFDRMMRTLPAHAWAARVRMRPGELRPPAALPLIRLRELEVHHVDLDVGYGFGDVDPDVAQWIIDDILMELGRRAEPPSVHIEAIDTGLHRELGRGASLISGAQADLLAWLSGRSPGTGLTTEGTGAPPDAPYWI